MSDNSKLIDEILSKYTLVFSDDAYNDEASVDTLKTTKYEYNNLMIKLNNDIEKLDRYDNFDRLLIDPSRYKKNENSIYGIEYNNKIHTNKTSVIRPQQADAALQFLQIHRGFGILADPVGSGKTYEAGVVLSELAIRNKIKSMLLIVPEAIITYWKDVLELQFGMGKDALVEAFKRNENNDYDQDILSLHDYLEDNNINIIQRGDFMAPERPIIMRLEDFSRLDEADTTLLFDAVVVDEAHHLCNEEGQYGKAMWLLSKLMETKKKAKSSYCLLLSATPHSGNLENMFRLWYFVRCQGGNSSDFAQKDESKRTENYKNEKKYYFTHVCRSAKTVKEFIDNTLNDIIHSSAYYDDYKKFEKKYEDTIISENDLIQKFYESLPIDEKENVTSKIGHAYKSVLRTIMVRGDKVSVRKQKNVINYLFIPKKDNNDTIITIRENNKDLNINLDYISSLDEVKYNNSCLLDGKSYSLSGAICEVLDKNQYQANDLDVKQKRNEIIARLLEGSNIFKDETLFPKKNSERYYTDQIGISNYALDEIVLVDDFNKNINNNVKTNVLKEKLKRTVDIINKHDNQRVIIFFDYDIRNNPVIPAVKTKLKEIYGDRIISTSNISASNLVAAKQKLVEFFNQKEDAILIVESQDFTESVNLQKCNIIINFQVTFDPLAMDQRIGRIFRLGQENDINIYSLADLTDLEGYALMYFTRIGIMNSDSGDATIIAGSNNEHMVALRCKQCGYTKLMSSGEWEKYKEQGKSYYCTNTKNCSINGRGTPMTEISLYDFKCNECGTLFTRDIDADGYLCIANIANKGKLVTSIDVTTDQRKHYCSKLCAMKHCSKLNKIGCRVLEAVADRGNLSEAQLRQICNQCNNQLCPKECRYLGNENGEHKCLTCKGYTGACRPYVLTFNKDWVAPCPNPTCHNGYIKPVLARTFATYIKSAWNNKYEIETFCENLGEEANKASIVKKILETNSKGSD